MKFNEKEISLLLKDLLLNKEIELSDIPDLELYMDQVITLFDDKLSHLKRFYDEKLMTKTMINNYTKSKILIPPNKKKYSKEHMILLILIYNLKQSLSINDIGILFKDLLDHVSNDNDIDLHKIYESFLEIKKYQEGILKNELPDKIKFIEESTSGLDLSNKDLSQMLIFVLSLINEANIRKRLAEKIIDGFFTNDRL
ncbi:hypothetical protein CLHOM_10530 [Clostridium homopropionicum DSM 5847]|uniref:DUF1836 domain-containing protein n=1 Tax=Clostridium homopropionicum DSM 5847 TaxID=1121318 RepID=A0A0L6ZBW3_9CLOT|nr:DUF1836 domain-containing protein [Clostridium homopropionicum]KOA20465.1 hypothetical protein CLHOM_10530 [Clostridium homopropionicum DSM 5847]SFG35827.1 protein of unknown function [Clostridium homopropionicum]